MRKTISEETTGGRIPESDHLELETSKLAAVYSSSSSLSSSPTPEEEKTSNLNITFFSAASFPLAFPPTIARGFGFPKIGLGVEGVNSRVGKWLIDFLSSDGDDENQGKRIRGWTLMDFYSDPEGNGIVPLLVECNFRGRISGEES